MFNTRKNKDDPEKIYQIFYISTFSHLIQAKTKKRSMTHRA